MANGNQQNKPQQTPKSGAPEVKKDDGAPAGEGADKDADSAEGTAAPGADNAAAGAPAASEEAPPAGGGSENDGDVIGTSVEFNAALPTSITEELAICAKAAMDAGDYAAYATLHGLAVDLGALKMRIKAANLESEHLSDFAEQFLAGMVQYL